MIRIYSKPGCGMCEEAKKYLDSRGVEYEDINLALKENREARAYYRIKGVRTLPVIEDDKWIMYEYNEEMLDKYLERYYGF